MPSFDPRTLNKYAFKALQKLSDDHKGKKARRKDQKNQAQELYTYISTWGLMRLKAEEKVLKSQEGRQEVVEIFFKKLKKLLGMEKDQKLDLNYLVGLPADQYLGLTGLAIELANEFAFWANAVYADLEGAQAPDPQETSKPI
ncbi:MAG: hypothetical protein F6J87_12555 [Spirulina sp. SIO3F2]|nr:hypothetical protein [Spirulina sp. SIO3F2]